MNLLRGVGRLMLGGFYIVNGIKSIKEPARYVAQAEPVADRLEPLARKLFGPDATSYLSEKPEALIRINGAMSLLGGLGLVSGFGRRVGGGLAAASMVIPVLGQVPDDATEVERAEYKVAKLRDLALFGAALIVTQDTAGRPSLAWKAAETRRRMASESSRAKKLAKRKARHARKGTKGSLS